MILRELNVISVNYDVFHYYGYSYVIVYSIGESVVLVPLQHFNI